MITLLTIVGARPQFIKAAALSRAIRERFPGQFREIILHTGQHYDADMSEVFFEQMHIPRPDHMLETGSLSHGAQTGRMLEGIEAILLKEKPDAIVVYGDTNSTLAGAIAASKIHIPVIHIEAGLRSFSKKMPEEINRIASDHVSTMLFSPTDTGVENLKAEGLVHKSGNKHHMDNPGIYQCGDLMYDNTLHFKEVAGRNSDILNKLDVQEGRFILATVHRPSNTDSPENLLGILEALSQLGEERDLDIVLPLHPRTRSILEKHRGSGLYDPAKRSGRLKLCAAVSFLDMIRLEAESVLVATDSGGVQKEAFFLEKPVVVLRNETEWVEIIRSGNGILTGPSGEKILDAARKLLDNPPSDYPGIFGNGKAAESILQTLLDEEWG